MSNEQTTTLRGVTCVVTDCISCGVIYTVPLSVHQHHQAMGGYHYCPNGHGQGWNGADSELGRTRRERDNLRQQQARAADELRDMTERRNTLERDLAAETKKRRTLQRRVEHGVCPDCNRTFANMARHMQHKHGAAAAKPKLVAVPEKTTA